MSKTEEQYESYEGFLRGAIRTYWESGQGSKVNFLALLLASRETWSVAWEGATASGSGKKILTGAAGAAAVALLLRTLLGGPIGILLTGASIASLGALYVKNHKHIWQRVDHYKELIDQHESKFQGVQDDYVEGGLRRDQRDLMLDELMTRFLVTLDEFEPDLEEDEAGEEDEGAESSDFDRHATRKRAEEEASVSKDDADGAKGKDDDEASRET